MLAKLDCPLRQSSRLISVLHHGTEWLFRQYFNRVRLEVRAQHSFLSDNGGGHFLKRRVSCLWVGHSLARIEDRFLFSPIFSYEDAADCGRRYCNIKRERIAGLGLAQHERSGKVLLELSECLLAFLIPDETFVTAQQFVKRKALVSRSRDEMVKCCDSYG